MSIVQLHIAQSQREQDLNIAESLRWDTILANYIKEMSDLFTSSNYSYLNSDPVLHSILRAKSLIASRQLNAKRKTYLIQFLYDSGALFADRNPIDLSGAVLDGIDLNTPKLYPNGRTNMQGITLQDTSLINALFARRELNNANFMFSDLTGANFYLAKLQNAIFQTASLRFANFIGATVDGADLSTTDLTGSNIDEEQLQQAGSILFALLPNGTLARNPPMITDGNAESYDLCQEKQFSAFRQGRWIVNPPGSVGTIGTSSTIIEGLSNRGMGSFFEEDSMLQRGYRIFFDMGKCSIAVQGHDTASMVQHFPIPEQYRIDKRKYFWVLTAFCGILDITKTDAVIGARLLELDDKNDTIGGFSLELTNTGIFEPKIPYNKTATRASFELYFEYSTMATKETLQNDAPWAFCDNIYLSIERISGAAFR